MQPWFDTTLADYELQFIAVAECQSKNPRVLDDLQHPSDFPSALLGAMCRLPLFGLR